MIDKEASARLRQEVQRLYLERTGRTTFSVLALSEWSGVNREPLRRYLQNGTFPDPDVLAKLATALGVPTAHLWMRWLNLPAHESGFGLIAREIRELRVALTQPAQADDDAGLSSDLHDEAGGTAPKRRASDHRNEAEG